MGMETEYVEKPKNGRRRNPRWIWCCAGVFALWIFACCSIPIMMMMGAAVVSANEVTETSTETLSVDDVEGTINLEVTNPVGATSIVGDSDADEIEVEIVRRANAFTKADARSIVENITVDVRRDGNDFIVEVEHADEHDGFMWFNSPSVDLRITVPQELNLTVENNVGGLTVRDVDIVDRMELTNNVGGIEFEGVIGPQGDYTITNNVGGISIEVSEDSSFELDVTANVGGIDMQLGDQWHESDYSKDSPGERYEGTYGDQDNPDATLTITTDVGGIEIHD
jgi:hypothetical protein